MPSFISSFFNFNSVFPFFKLLTPTLNYQIKKEGKKKKKEHKMPFIFIVKSMYIYALVDMLCRIFRFKCYIADLLVSALMVSALRPNKNIFAEGKTCPTGNLQVSMSGFASI